MICAVSSWTEWSANPINYPSYQENQEYQLVSDKDKVYTTVSVSAGVQGCTAPPFFENHHIAPLNFEQFIDNAPHDDQVTLISKFPLKLCTPVFKFLTHALPLAFIHKIPIYKYACRYFFSKHIFFVLKFHNGCKKISYRPH